MRPNILLIMTDQQRWDALGCSGGWVKTPHIDRIASQGIRFPNCVTNAPVCVPARVSLATGCYPHNTGILANMLYDMPTNTITWMQMIRDSGYQTSLFGKTHLHQHKGDLRLKEHWLQAYGLDTVDEIGGPRACMTLMSHMTDRWQQLGIWQAYKADFRERFTTKPYLVRPSPLPLEEYSDVYVGQQAKKYLGQYHHSDPWFCWVSFGGPHEPWDAPEPYASLYKPEDMPAAFTLHDTDQRPLGLMDHLLERIPKPNVTEIAQMRANYAGNVTLIDEQIGQILAILDKKDYTKNTVIVFCSDHGELNGDYGLIYKNTFFNSAVRIPLIIQTPHTLQNPSIPHVSHSLIEWFDIGPTLVELSGAKLKVDESIDQYFARSFAATLFHPDKPHRSFVTSEIRKEIMYMDKHWKMILNAQGQPYLLFNLAEDPNEEINEVNNPDYCNKKIEIRICLQEHLIQTQSWRMRQGRY